MREQNKREWGKVVNAETLKYCQRAVVRYLNGDMEEFQRLVGQAMAIYNSGIEICECGAEMIQAYEKHGDEKKKIWLCMKCRRRKENGFEQSMHNNSSDVINDRRVHSQKTSRKKKHH